MGRGRRLKAAQWRRRLPKSELPRRRPAGGQWRRRALQRRCRPRRLLRPRSSAPRPRRRPPKRLNLRRPAEGLRSRQPRRKSYLENREGEGCLYGGHGGPSGRRQFEDFRGLTHTRCGATRRSESNRDGGARLRSLMRLLARWRCRQHHVPWPSRRVGDRGATVSRRRRVGAPGAWRQWRREHGAPTRFGVADTPFCFDSLLGDQPPQGVAEV